MIHILPDSPMVMVDVETLSTKPNAAIIQIAATKFTINDGITDEFVINVERNENFHIDPKVEAWWSNQPIAAQESWKSNPVTINHAVDAFAEWLGKTYGVFFWSQGTAFDFPILQNAFDYCGYPKYPWYYPLVMDTRTIFAFAGIDHKQGSVGTMHVAIDDCKTQVKHLRSIF